MKTMPLLVQRAELVQAHSRLVHDETAFCDDELPAVLHRDVSGYVLSRGTYVTEVKRETVDDN